jgi:hypothetical protein
LESGEFDCHHPDTLVIELFKKDELLKKRAFKKAQPKSLLAKVKPKNNKKKELLKKLNQKITRKKRARKT